MNRQPGKFWPKVRPLIWKKAEELYQKEQASTMGNDYKAIKPEKRELRQSGYFHMAKIIVLRNLYRQKKGLPTVEEEEMMRQYGGSLEPDEWTILKLKELEGERR